MSISKKEALFNLYSNNLAINSNLNGWFICPLCLKGFSIEHLDSLTLEHIVPKSLGGKLITLTCWKCNNDFGSKLISKLYKNIQIKEILSGTKNGFLDSKFSIDGHSVSALFEPGKDSHNLIFNPKRSNPEDTEYIQSKFKKNDVNNFNLIFNAGYSKKEENSALLLIAYLLMFYQFGYFFVFSRFGLHIRGCLINELYETPFLSFSDISEWALESDDPLIMLCSKPKEFLNHAYIQIPLITQTSKHVYGTFIPFLPGTKIDENAYKINRQLQITATQLPDPWNLLKDTKLKLPGNLRITILDEDE